MTDESGFVLRGARVLCTVYWTAVHWLPGWPILIAWAEWLVATSNMHTLHRDDPSTLRQTYSNPPSLPTVRTEFFLVGKLVSAKCLGLFPIVTRAYERLIKYCGTWKYVLWVEHFLLLFNNVVQAFS